MPISGGNAHSMRQIKPSTKTSRRGAPRWRFYRPLVPEAPPEHASRTELWATRKPNISGLMLGDKKASVIRTVLNELTVEGSDLPEDFFLLSESNFDSMGEQDEGEVD